jgi:drug/metabolite transporter (DMT)-like permease
LARVAARTGRAPTIAAAGRNPLAWFSLVAVYFLWGSTYPAIRVAVETIPPLLQAGVRYVAAGALLLPIALRLGDRDGDRPGRAQWVAAGIYGLALMVGGNGGVSWGEQTVPGGTAALIVASVSLWMVVMDRVVNGVRIGTYGVVGLLAGFAGVALLANPSGGADTTGALVIVGASVSWAAGSVYARTAPMPRRALVATGMAMLVGGLVLLVAAAVTGEFGELRLDDVSGRSLAGLLWLIGPGALLGFSAYTYALGSLPTSTVATYAYVNPVVAVAIGWVLLGETLTWRSLVAGALVLAAVALILTTRSRATRSRAGGARPSAQPGTGRPAPARTLDERTLDERPVDRAAQPDQPGVTSPDS